MRRFFALPCLLLFAVWVQAAEIQPFSASYSADSSQLPFGGSASRSLVKAEDGIWHLAFSASMLIASFSESSHFRLQADSVLPLDYQLLRSGLGKSGETQLAFDWAGGQVSGSYRDKPLNLPLTAGVLDKSSYQVALQRDLMAGKKTMSYPIIDGNKLEVQQFRVLGDEPVKTGVGSLDAVKVERVRAGGAGRQTRLWFAKDYGFLLVRLEQVEKDGKSYQIMLKQAEVAGRKVNGR